MSKAGGCGCGCEGGKVVSPEGGCGKEPSKATGTKVAAPPVATPRRAGRNLRSMPGRGANRGQMPPLAPPQGAGSKQPTMRGGNLGASPPLAPPQAGDLRLDLVDADDVVAAVGQAGPLDQPDVPGADDGDLHGDPSSLLWSMDVPTLGEGPTRPVAIVEAVPRGC